MKTLLLLFLALIACTGTDFSADLVDHPNALTTAGDDLLFELVVDDSVEAYTLSELELVFQRPGDSRVALNFELSVDANGDGLLGTGDTLVGREPTSATGPDILGPNDAGASFDVELMLEIGPSRVQELWIGDWQADL